MERTRESRRSSMPPSTPRRRALRVSSQEGQVEVLKVKRDRDSLKRRRGSNSHTTEEESVGNEHQQSHYDIQMLSPSDQSHHRRNSTPLRHSNITDEMIGATVPRKARSASVKRTHDSWMEEQSLHSGETASPSSSNVSFRKKMKSIGPKTRLPKVASSSSTTQEDMDIEIEIAELLYGLRSSNNNHESSSQKLEASNSNPPRSTTPSSYPSNDNEKKKVEDYGSSTLAPNNSAGGSDRIESEKPAKMEKLSPESARISGCRDDDVSGHEIGSSEDRKRDIEEDNLNSDAGCGDTVDGRSELYKLDIDKQDSASTKALSAVPGTNNQRVDKFEIDLMAPPPMTLSPERDNWSRGEDDVKVERFVKKEKTQEEIEEVKMKFDLEKPNKHDDVATNHGLDEHERNMEHHKVEKTVQSSSMPLSTAVSKWPSTLSLLGYMPPLDTVVKTDKTTESTTAQKQLKFVLSQPRPKRCATHHYIARNIFMHEQCTKMNHLLPSGTGYGSPCDTMPNNGHRMCSAENVVDGKHSQNHSPGMMNQNAAQEKGCAATSDYSLAAIKSSGPANPMDSIQMKQLVLQQYPHPGSSGNLVHGPAFLFPPGQHQTSITAANSQAGGANSTSSASSSSKSHSSVAGSLGTSTLPAAAAAMNLSYPNLAVNDAPYVTLVQNSGYPFPFSTPLGASATIRGASPAQGTPILTGPLYSSHMFHPLQHPQQHPHSQPLVQPSYLNGSTASISTSSQKQSQGTQVNNNNILTSTTMQQSQKQSTSLSHPCKHETGMAEENALSVAGGTAYSQKNVFGQNYTIPVQPLNLSFRPSATSDRVASNAGNFGDKQQHQQALKGGVERIPSQAFAISFSAFNGTSVPSNLNFSSMAQNPVIFQSLPDIAWQGYRAAGASHATQQKVYSITEGKSGGNPSHQDDEKKATSGKPSTNVPTTLVFDNSSNNLNFASASMNGNWPSRSITSTATTASSPLSINASNSQHLLHLQQHGISQQQPAIATRYKASSTTANATTATKFFSPPVFSPTQTQYKSSDQASSQSKNLGRTLDSRVHNTSIITSTTPTFKSFPQEQGRVLQGHTQISFGGNYIPSLPPQGQKLLNNNQPFGTKVAGTPPNGGNLKTNSQGSKASSSMNSSQMQQTENSSAGTGPNSSPVCGRIVPSILSSCPSHLSELKY